MIYLDTDNKVIDYFAARRARGLPPTNLEYEILIAKVDKEIDAFWRLFNVLHVSHTKENDDA